MSFQVNFVWIGPRLGSMHAACLRSFQRHGHDVVLHSFDAPEDVPSGVKIFDASKLMRRNEIIAHRKTGSLSLASDIYRYRMLREGMGIYVDCDVYCLRPFPNQEYLFGWETNDTISNAVLGAPPNSDLASKLTTAADDESFIPPWRSKRTQQWLRMRNAIGLPLARSNMAWGTLGPSLLTYSVKKLGLADHAMPIDAFYSLHYSQTPLLLDPGIKLENLITPRSYALHLANAMHKTDAVAAGSPLHQIISSP